MLGAIFVGVTKRLVEILFRFEIKLLDKKNGRCFTYADYNRSAPLEESYSQLLF